MDMTHIIDGLIGVIVLGGGWFLGTQSREVKRIDILLNKTREEVATNYVLKSDNKDIIKSVMERFDKLEEKIDKLMEK